MYTREILPERDTPIENGTPLHGTWSRPFAWVDLQEIQRPFRLPLPQALRELRIKEWLSFSVENGRFFVHAMLYNLKVFRGAEVLVYDYDTGELLRFRKALPFSGWRLPRSLYNGAVESTSMDFFFRIHTWLDADCILVDLNMGATRKRPAFTAHFRFDMDRRKISPMTVNLLFSERRSMYAHKALAPVRGSMVFGGGHYSLDPDSTTGLFSDFKGFYPYRATASWVSAAGFIPVPGRGGPENAGAPDGTPPGEARKTEGSRLARAGFTLGENQTKDQNHANENALWVDGELTPLPPVRITWPEGINGEWIIQDLEGMVDLAFTPEKKLGSAARFPLARADYDNPLGYFNGILLNSRGEKIPVKNMKGLGERLRLKV